MKNIYNLSFGVTSAIMTSLAIVVGLGGTASAMTIITALLVIAVADNISDSFGIHIYKESQGSSKKDVKETTLGNFVARLITTLVFIIFVMFLSTNLAMIFSIIFSLLSIMIVSYFISLHQKKNPYISILRHLAISVVVLVSSLLLREIISKIL